ncbi:MAG: phosphodiesterase [Clostridia bacterium]|nr:phosphodiesterase [Clostridia bacterium]
MKFLIASDLHGDLAAARLLLERFEHERADRLILLGDLLYHGPRNDLPQHYEPKGVIALLNAMHTRILAVRGNCDTEVDQTVLHFPILSDYAVFPLSNGSLAYLTHGHKYPDEHALPLAPDDVIVRGHTHVAGVSCSRDGHVMLNPGSLSIPKDGTPRCYMVYDGHSFAIRELCDGRDFAVWEPIS